MRLDERRPSMQRPFDEAAGDHGATEAATSDDARQAAIANLGEDAKSEAQHAALGALRTPPAKNR